ncbi:MULTISPECIES: ammonium transporter [Brevibacillus]|jgi:ammonium transporter, Amt family|uniref:ammonium transporter n=1 Tax=Brevibacillus TaxID=55080 RepID=UPI0004F31C1F|nr:ammonium transporter [Brevibacillus borstelensis]KKX56257.1 ammonium transporter [Brevibacillus borstelensis cifa_chp40]MBE5395495.1 ammonium transporter [Brevibacillus borstelensis]MCM3470489.1 ammonium transporter [Brevibacillus borstelensis]MCM3558043.1 ammonium transporter [Brevibacillus borstelensis]MCM3592017.1 ammonium transporter [Brevibacillus borstelensis]
MEPTFASLASAIDATWVMVAAILVILMQAGFALLEAGSTRMKNAGHVAGKTVLTFGLCTLAFWALGFGLTFGNGNEFIGLGGFFFDPSGENAADSFSNAFAADIPISLFFLFQLAFAAVSLAIAWGGFAERAKLSIYVIFSFLFTIVIYPVIGHWVWGGGWLAELGMQDFAGSTVVHLQGAVAALAATILLKPRIGKYNRDGSSNPIPGHNQVYTVLGVILLWIGWFGFNAGSTLGSTSGFFAYVALTTNLGAAAGAVAAMAIAWSVTGKADIPTMLNGVIAALVAITASCAFVEPWAAVVIGSVSGILTYFTAIWFDRKGIDDPVYAFSVHGVAGIWGTLSTGFFATPELVEQAGVGAPGLFYGGGWHQLGVQALGLVGSLLYVFIVSYVILAALKATIGLRVTEEEEVIGLDLSEHGGYGYPELLPAEHISSFKRNGSHSLTR